MDTAYPFIIPLKKKLYPRRFYPMKKGMTLLLTALILMLMLTLTACGSSKDGETANTEPEAAPVYCPLDGEEITGQDCGDYVFVVSIDNGAKSEPQSGISEADLLIDIPVEGGINRFMAFFYHHTPDTIGPVRSARHYFYDIIGGYDAVMCHCGGSEQAYEVIDSGEEKDIDEMSCGNNFWRSDDRKAPHNLYTSYAKLSEKAAERGYAAVPADKCPSFAFMTAEEVSALTFGGTADLKIPYHFKEVSYLWDEAAGNYQRYSKGELHTDLNNGNAVTADNIVVLYVPYSVIDDKGRLDMTISAGSGHILQYGTAQEISWTLSDDNGFTFTAADGSEIKLIPGRTIIHIASPEQQAVYSVPEPAAETAEAEAQQ